MEQVQQTPSIMISNATPSSRVMHLTYCLSWRSFKLLHAFLLASIGAVASSYRPRFFSKIIMLSASPRYLKDEDYFGGFEHEDFDQLFDAMIENYHSWCYGFAPLWIGADMDSLVMQEFSRTLFSMRSDIALNQMNTIFQCDLRPILVLVSAPCHIIQYNNDLVVPLLVSEFLYHNLGGCSVVEMMGSKGHLPHMSSPVTVIPVLLGHIRLDITN